MNSRNNVNGIGRDWPAGRLYVEGPWIDQAAEDLVRKIVSELRDADNLYYEIANEPYLAASLWSGRRILPR